MAIVAERDSRQPVLPYRKGLLSGHCRRVVKYLNDLSYSVRDVENDRIVDSTGVTGAESHLYRVAKTNATAKSQ